MAQYEIHLGDDGRVHRVLRDGEKATNLHLEQHFSIVRIYFELAADNLHQLEEAVEPARWASAEYLKCTKLFLGRGVFLDKLDDGYLRHDGPEHVLVGYANIF